MKDDSLPPRRLRILVHERLNLITRQRLSMPRTYEQSDLPSPVGWSGRIAVNVACRIG